MHQASNEHANNVLEDQWAVVLDPYEDHPIKALILAQNFQAIKDILETGPQGAVQVFSQWTRL